jgi:FtsH-binding integral membrane protein
VAFSLPWYSTGEKSYSGWNFVIPFSMTYLIGIILGFIVLITRLMPFGLTIAAGVLMLVGVAVGVLGGEVGVAVSELTGETGSAQGGIGFAFVMSIIYLILGAWLGKRMKPENYR